MLQSGDVVPGDVSLLFVVGEETDGVGMKSVGHSYNASWEIGIFGEPTELKLGVGHKGILMCYVNVEGEASHSGYPELGISATEILLPVLNDFLTSDWPVDELLGPTTLNIAQISAGVAANVIPPFANASIFFRVSSDLEALDKKVRSKLDGIEHLSYDIPFESAPVYLDYEVPGFESIILAYATDIPNLYHHNLTRRYLYGPGTIHVAHSDHEYVESKDLVDAVDGYKKLIKYNLEY
ncbi:hypothetical protein CANTEDRAFT_116901 [Yamadazyma tenuis ATCC 10573]|nr:uncharacterized protein CANTEDRAFT_116901 [Yamadazyma tenuis ATCC 10573]EGV60837.1 hypothetical protein CANTEDRAFT_116901 [Yamadazyma tenuis ATCC 10573]